MPSTAAAEGSVIRNPPRDRTGAGKPRRPWLVVAGMGVWILAPVAALIIIAILGQQTTLTHDEVVLVSPVENTDASSRQVSLALEWAESPHIVAPAWGGIVQASKLVVGEPVTSGDTILTISNVSRIAFASPAPFTRPLSKNDSGSDVGDLHSFLATRGFAVPEGNKFTTITATAVEQFSLSIGAPKSSTFDPSWVVYLYADSVQVASSELVVGAPAPSAGSVLFTVEPALRSATIVQYQTNASAPTPGQSEGVAIADPSSQSAGLGLAAMPAETLLIGGQEIQLADSRNSVLEADLATVRAHAAIDARFLGAALWSEPVPGTWRVPTGVVVDDGSASHCVIQMDGQTSSASNVELVSESRGIAIVRGKLTEDMKLVVAPVSGTRSCD